MQRIRLMRLQSLVAFACFTVVSFASAQVSITKSSAGWVLTNGGIHVEIVCSKGDVQLKSLRRETGAEWAVTGSPIVAFPEKGGQYQFSEDSVSSLPNDGKQLTLRFKS